MRVPQLNSLCYAKMILHALKYPHCAVVGLLMGEAEVSGLLLFPPMFLELLLAVVCRDE